MHPNWGRYIDFLFKVRDENKAPEVLAHSAFLIAGNRVCPLTFAFQGAHGPGVMRDEIYGTLPAEEVDDVTELYDTWAGDRAGWQGGEPHTLPGSEAIDLFLQAFRYYGEPSQQGPNGGR